MKWPFRVRFGLKTLLAAVTLCAAGFGWLVYEIQYYRACHEQEQRVLAGLDEHFGDVPATKSTTVKVNLRYYHGNPDTCGLLKSRHEERTPCWIRATRLPLPSEWFQRTTHVTVHETKCLQDPSLAKTTIGAPPEFFPSHVLHQLASTESFDGERAIDWPAQTARMEQLRQFYRELSGLTDLECLRPGPLFGDAELSLFQDSRSLKLLDLSAEPDAHGWEREFPSSVTNAGILSIADGFPALRFLIIQDHSLWGTPGQWLQPYAAEAVAQLRAARPDLTIIYFQRDPEAVNREAPGYGDIVPAVEAQVLEIRRLAPDLDLQVPKVVYARYFEPGGKPSAEALRLLQFEFHLTALDFRDTLLDDESLDAVALAPQLSYLGIARTNVTRNGLRRLSGCKNLTAMYLSDALVADGDGIEIIRGLSALKTLLLDGSMLDGKALASLQESLPHLTVHQRPRVLSKEDEKWRCVFASNVPPWAKHLAPSPFLEAFDVTKSVTVQRVRRSTDAFTDLAGPYSTLLSLAVYDSALTTGDLTTIGSFPPLRRLNISRMERLSDDAIAPLFACHDCLRSLEEIRLENCPVGTPTLKRLLALPSIRKIELWNTKCVATDAPPVSRLGLRVDIRE